MCLCWLDTAERKARSHVKGDPFEVRPCQDWQTWECVSRNYLFVFASTVFNEGEKGSLYPSVNKQDHGEKDTTFILSMSLPNRKAVTGDSILTACSLNL